MPPPRIQPSSPHPSTHAASRAAPIHTPPQPAAPRATPPHQADTFGAGDHARDAALRTTIGSGTGRGYDTQVVQGTMHAVDMAQRPVDFSHPEQTLHDHSQLDADGRTTGDESRCGATALVGGLVLSGHEAPQRLHDARAREQAHLTDVQHGLQSAFDQSAMRHDGSADSARYAQGLQDAREAHRLLAGLPDSPQASWTHGQLSQFEEATYRLGRAEQVLHHDPVADGDTGLRGSEILRLRETVWGQGWQPHTSDGHPVDVVYAGQRSASGEAQLNHFVLGTDDVLPGGNRATVYDPWPADDGTNFSRIPGQPEQLLGGGAISTGDGAALRPGADVDFFRGEVARDRFGPTDDQRLEALGSRR